MLIRGLDANNSVVRNLLCDSAGRLLAVLVGAGSGGTSSNFGDPFPLGGTAAGFQDASGNMAGGKLDGSGNLKVDLAAADALVFDGSGFVKVNVAAGSVTTTPPAAATAALSSVTANGATSQLALASNAARLAMVFYNDTKDTNCYLKYGATASTASYTMKLAPQQRSEPIMNYTGRVDAIWDGAPNQPGQTDKLFVTELTA